MTLLFSFFIVYSFGYHALPSEHLHGLQEADIPHHHGAPVIVPLLPNEVGGELEQDFPQQATDGSLGQELKQLGATQSFISTFILDSLLTLLF